MIPRIIPIITTGTTTLIAITCSSVGRRREGGREGEEGGRKEGGRGGSRGRDEKGGREIGEQEKFTH